MTFILTHKKNSGSPKIRALIVCGICFWFLALFLPAASVLAQSSSTETAGNVLTALVPAVGAGMTFLKDDDKGKYQFLSSGVVNLSTCYVLDAATNNERSKNPDNKGSFPSQHTAIAFGGASFIHCRYGFEYAIPAYAAASYVAYSRLQADKHYPGDVIAGAAIGFVSSYLFTTPYLGVQISPSVSKGNYFLNFFANW